MEVESAIDHKLIRSLQLEIAKLMVDLSSQKDALEEAITTQGRHYKKYRSYKGWGARAGRSRMFLALEPEPKNYQEPDPLGKKSQESPALVVKHLLGSL